MAIWTQIAFFSFWSLSISAYAYNVALVVVSSIERSIPIENVTYDDVIG